MPSQRALSGFLRWGVICGGVLGALLAIDAFAVFLFLLLTTVFSGGPPNPYAGLVVYLVLPILILIGLGAAWGAYEYLMAPAAQERETAAAITR
jgi:hypothetical protein